MNPADLKLIGIIGAVYLVGRTIGKVLFVNLTARAVKCDRVICRYLGFTLFSQAGVALGLAVYIEETFRDTIYASQAHLILTTITGTIIVVQVIGPLLVRWAIHRAGEVGEKEERLHVAEALFFEDKVSEIKEDVREYATEDEEKNDKEFISIGDRLTKLKKKMKLRNNDYIRKKRKKL